VVAKDLQHTLTALGYRVSATVASGEEALRAAAERRPDLVLMDIRIRGERDGIETARALREQFDVPVVYLTAYGDEETLERAKATTPHGYLLKPVTPIELRSTIEVALARHDTERQLRERDRWFAAVARSAGDALISTDTQGHITFMNPVAEALTGTSAREAKGRRLREILRLRDERSRAEVADPVERALRLGSVVRLESATLVPANGEERIVADSAAPILDETGAVVGAVLGLHDVTEQRQLQERLERAERLASLGTLAAGVAHEINNPLAFILANLEFALAALGEGKLPPWTGQAVEVAAALREARTGVERVRRIVADLNVFARPGAGSPSRVDVRRVLEWALGVVAPFAHERARIVKKFAEVPDVVADETRLGQVFTNLLLNAVQAIPVGRPDENQVQITVQLFSLEEVLIEIRDTGAGMPDDVRTRIFDPFFTTKPIGQGTGLGLAICHGIVTSLGGRIDVDSELGEGTTFRVILPAAPDDAVAAAAAREAVHTTTGARLLVVDDEPLVCRALGRALGRDHDVRIAETGAQALALIGAGARFDVILCDLMMPDIGGMEVYRELAASAPDQARRIVFVTGGAFSPEAQEFLRTLEHPHVEKPFNMSELLARLHELLVTWGRAADPP